MSGVEDFASAVQRVRNRLPVFRDHKLYLRTDQGAHWVEPKMAWGVINQDSVYNSTNYRTVRWL